MRVLDLFAGSGSVGIEALSQGPEHCTFIDCAEGYGHDQKNLANAESTDRAMVWRGDGLGILRLRAVLLI